MNTIKLSKRYISAAILFAAFQTAQATTYSNLPDGGTVSPLGAPDTTSYGEFFVAPAGILQDFSFYAINGNAGNVALRIAAWDGSKAVGPALYNSAAYSYQGGASTLSFSGINLNLTSGNSYIAYLTVAGVTSPISDVTMQMASGDGGLGGGFAFLNSGGADPLNSNYPWYKFGQLTYTANIAAVPEPETYAMLLGGLALLSAAARRRKAG